MADLQTIWTYAIETLLGVDKKEIAFYRAVLVIPALYKRTLMKHYMTLLLQKIGFGQAFLLQDHVAATFGAGLGKTGGRHKFSRFFSPSNDPTYLVVHIILSLIFPSYVESFCSNMIIN